MFDLDDLDDLDDGDCDGIVGVGVEAFESVAGLCLTRLREPMAHVECGEIRGFLQTYRIRGVAGCGREGCVFECYGSLPCHPCVVR